VEAARQEGEREALRREMQQQQALLQRVQATNARLELLAGASAELLLAPRPREVVASLLARASGQLAAEVYLLHLAPDGDALELELSGGVPSVLARDLAGVPPEATIFGRAAATRRTVLAERGDAAAFPSMRLLGVTAAVASPLLAGERLIGTLTFATRARPRLDGGEAAVLEILADGIAMALERERLVSELRRRADDLAETDRRKDQFLAMLAHELRNPLAPILHAVELMRHDGADPQACRRALDATDRQVRHMARLVDDLVDVSRIRTGKIELRRAPVELRAVVEPAVQALEPLLRELRHELAVALPPEPLWVDADAVRLTQVVENLLHNAAKYTDAGGHLRLDAARRGGEVELRVADDGIGIPPEVLPHVFDVFVQAEQPPDRARGGLGLGLSLVRSIVELHGGRVVARSDGPGRGSELTVTLPLAEPPRDAPRAEAAPAPAPGAKRLRIALVEDNADVRETLGQLLAARGHVILEADDGARAIELVAAERPDVALVDIGLPGLDGYEVAARVRAAAPATKLVAVTGYGGADDRRRALEAGFDAHLVKPVDLAELTTLLARLA
jgi:signal transduction histidine kinase